MRIKVIIPSNFYSNLILRIVKLVIKFRKNNLVVKGLWFFCEVWYILKKITQF